MNLSPVVLFLSGIFAGILGGMGFGGGTVLIPILTLLLKLPVPLAVWVNLAAFLPSAVVALFFHTRNGLVVWKGVFYLLIFGFVGVILMFFIKNHITESLVKKAFGCFLIAVGSVSIICVFVGFIKKNRHS